MKTYQATYYWGEYMVGWRVWEKELEDSGIARYFHGAGLFLRDGVAQALANAPKLPRENDVIEFTEEDVERVAQMIREARAKQEATRQMVRCDCGHTVPRNLVMSASRGTSCPDCYDSMSK